MSYQSVILADSPVAYWPVDETSGTVVHDLSGNGWNGVYMAGVSLGAVPFPAGGAGATFDGSTGYAYGDSGVPTAATANVTMEVWVNFNGNTAPNGGCALNNGQGASNGYVLGNGYGTYGFITPGNDIVGGYETYTWNQTTVPIPLSGWHHIVCVIGADSASTFFLDGVQVATVSNTQMNAPTTSWSIGGDYNRTEWVFDGAIANAALYDTALSAAQILSHYNAGIATPSGSPLYTGGGTDAQFLLLQR